jgi:hypothetical protein
MIGPQAQTSSQILGDRRCGCDRWLSDPLGAAALARKWGGDHVHVGLGIYEYAASKNVA